MRIVTARRLVDGTGAPALDWPAVVIDDSGNLAYVGPRAALPSLGDDVERVDLGAWTILPGMIDSHVHLAFDGGPDPVTSIQAVDDDTLLAEMAERAGRMLRSGLTTVRDCGARGTLAQQLQAAIAAGRTPGPRLVTAGAPLTIAQGHCHYLGAETPRGEAHVRAAAERQLAAGADWVKIMVSGGRITPGSDATRPQFERTEVAAAVEAAHAAGRRLAAHAHATVSIADAVTVGADSIEHCTWVGPDDEFDYAPTVAAQMAAQGTYACPTTNWRFQIVNSRRGPERFTARLHNLAHMRDAGVPFAFGTDCGIPNTPHDRWAEGIVWLEAAGLSPLEVIHAASGAAAHCLGVDSLTGTLTAGKQADLIATSGDPSRSLNELGRVSWVMQGGRIVVDERAL